MLRQMRAAIMCVIVATILFGFVFPFFITLIAQVAFPRQANGSLIEKGGKVIGSELIGQGLSGPGYFHPRPSAAGSGYDAASSGGTNLGPTSGKLINGINNKLPDGSDDPGNFQGVRDLAVAYRKDNGLPPNTVLPADAVTRSASGLDPEISPLNAQMQSGRVAKARGISEHRTRQLIAEHTTGRQFGVLGEPRVHVLRLNLALDEEAKIASK